jgi:radical SAM superfamily enzyme YgiQ (UPF0313 family)
MKVKLISPKSTNSNQGILELRYLSKLFGGPIKVGTIPLSIPTIAAITPKNIEVEIVDENVEQIDFDDRVDLVGISFMTSLAPRAYQIADEYRKRGITVVLGGIHASMLPEEAIQHADSIVIGEAEENWAQLINDFISNKIKRYYRSSTWSNLIDSLTPRWDLLKHGSYNSFLIQTTRGCPFDCDFCSARPFMGGQLRHKNIDKVVREIKSLKELIGNKALTFADDNTAVDRNYAKELFKAIKPLNIRWMCQTSIEIAKDDELLELAVESGALYFLIGLESVSQKSLDSVNKAKVNKAEDYLAAIEKIYSHGIGIFGSFIFGLDGDDETVFEKTVQFVQDSNMSLVLFHILTPFPGTRLFTRMEKEGRILHKKWEKYDGQHVCCKPKLMSPKTLQEGYYWALQKVYSYDASFKRLENLWNKNVWRKENVPTRLKAYLTMRLLKDLWHPDKEMPRYILKSIKNLWKPNINLGSILYNLNFHDFAYSLPEGILIKDGENQ